MTTRSAALTANALTWPRKIRAPSAAPAVRSSRAIRTWACASPVLAVSQGSRTEIGDPMSVLRITDLRQLRGISSNQSISMPASLMQTYRPRFLDTQMMAVYRRMLRMKERQ